MDVRRGYRGYHRQHKRYRKARFNNRSSSKRKSRIAPSIKQKKDAILRVINRINKWCKIDKIILEDVQIDIRALQDGKLYKWQYQKSNRLDENLRKATIIRDGNKCMECGKTNCVLEVHHIVPRRLGGNDSIYNLITLCSDCHDKTEGKEEKFIVKYQNKIQGKNINFSDAQHVMQGKTYLRQELNNIAPLSLTIGSETANKRIDWGIEKSHSNDAIVITGLKPDSCNIKEWTIRPMRRKSKARHNEVEGFKHRDLVKYKKKNGEIYVGWITALYPEKKQCNITTLDGKILKRYGLKSLKLIWRFEKIYWLCT
jgi:5-methylcytosine-specific restriction endonuclease McrA